MDRPFQGVLFNAFPSGVEEDEEFYAREGGRRGPVGGEDV